MGPMDIPKLKPLTDAQEARIVEALEVELELDRRREDRVRDFDEAELALLRFCKSTIWEDLGANSHPEGDNL